MQFGKSKNQTVVFAADWPRFHIRRSTPSIVMKSFGSSTTGPRQRSYKPRRLKGLVRYVRHSRSGKWFVIHAKPGKFFGHSSRVISGEVRVLASCTFTALPSVTSDERPRATEIVILPRGRDPVRSCDKHVTRNIDTINSDCDDSKKASF